MAPKYASEQRKSDSYDMEHFRRPAGSAERGMVWNDVEQLLETIPPLLI